MQPETVAESPTAAAVVAQLMSGHVFVSLAVGTAEQRAADLEAVLADFVDDGTRVAWVGNPLRSSLTIQRFLLQIVGPEIDLRIDRNPAELARVIAAARTNESRLLVVVQQPETIDPETLELLGALAGHLGEEAVQVQFLLVGAPGLRLPTVARAPIGQILLPPARHEVDPAETPAPEARRREVLPLILLLLAVSVGVVFTLAPKGREAELPPRASAETVAPTLPAAEVDTLRQQFEAFLAERATTLPPLSAAQKDALFAEFLSRRKRD